jgi:phosphoglycerate dehydrogenase-like enzyme
VTVLGFGAVGEATARLLTAFGATVIGVRRTGGHQTGQVEVLSVDRLRDALRRSSMLVVAAPLTAATRGVVDAAGLAVMTPGSLLVNVGRGPIVREAALVDALRSGQLAGAALDVFDVEPLPPRSPLWHLPNVIISPHCADATAATEDRSLEVFLANADRWRRGEPLRGVVDLAHGY